MLNVADCLIACFIFFLFLSIYRKRSSTSVRFWVVGWFCILLHFGALVWPPASAQELAAQSVVALCTLVLTAVVFALSDTRNRTSTARLRTGLLLGLPSLLVMGIGTVWPGARLLVTVFACASAASVLAVSAVLCGARSLRFAATVCLAAACLAWLLHSSGAVSGADTAEEVVLTLCFGLNAVLLCGKRPRFSAANLTLSFGATSWALVWLAAAAVERWLPHLAVSPELWNLPKYLLAAGMVLSVLDDEIRMAGQISAEYRLLFDGNPHPMWIYDAETLRFLEVNDAAVRQYGFSRAEFDAMHLPELMQGATADQALLQALRSPEPQTLAGPWRHRRKNGTELSVDIASQPVRRHGREATFALVHDVTESQRLHAQLLRQAHHDVLTGLPNRALFEARLQQALSQARANGESAAVLCIDLDRFKQINDTFGHDAGDRCLCAMAERITDRLAGRGTLARTGGDEFMLVLGALQDGREAELLARDLIDALRPLVALESGEAELLVSIGIAVFPEDGTTAGQLWRDADAAMYRAKRAGGGHWVRVSREISSAAAEANELERRLRRALRCGELVAVYQPQLSIAGELHGFEALVRFTDPILAEAPAERIITLAEETGLVVPLGAWMLEEVCRQSTAWRKEGRQPVRMALNVSALQIHRFDFASKVAATLERYALSAEMFDFEVTESTLMPDRGTTSDQIALLARMGIGFAVDDFGTGYSSLGRLHKLPVGALKIDGSFTRQLADAKGTYPTVRAIIGLAHTFGMDVVAEGVETEEQLRILRSLDCDRVQGYLFSRPLPAEQVKQLLTPKAAGTLREEVA